MPPPGAGFVTVMLKVPATNKSEAGIEAVSWVADTNVVVRAEPAKFTTDVEIKFVPFTVKVKVASPTFLDVGLIEVVVGTGLFADALNVAIAPAHTEDDEISALTFCALTAERIFSSNTVATPFEPPPEFTSPISLNALDCAENVLPELLAEIPATATSPACVVVSVVPEFPVTLEPVAVAVLSKTDEVSAPEYSINLNVALEEGLKPQEDAPD